MRPYSDNKIQQSKRNFNNQRQANTVQKEAQNHNYQEAEKNVNCFKPQLIKNIVLSRDAISANKQTEQIQFQKKEYSSTPKKLKEDKHGKYWKIEEQIKYIQCLKKMKNSFNFSEGISTHISQLMQKEIMSDYSVYKSAKQIKNHHKNMLFKYKTVDAIISELEKDLTSKQNLLKQKNSCRPKYKYDKRPNNTLVIEFSDDEIEKLIQKIQSLEVDEKGEKQYFTLRFYVPIVVHTKKK